MLTVELALSNEDLKSPFSALRAYYENLQKPNMITFVESLKSKYNFEEISWEDLLKYTLDDYKALDKVLGPTIQRVFNGLFSMIVFPFITNNKQNERDWPQSQIWMFLYFQVIEPF